ncbi:MAG: hypothetical protein ACU88J_10565 [Gammaproteobacteria bacterium]
MHTNKSKAPSLLLCILFATHVAYCSVVNAENSKFEIAAIGEENYPYSVIQAGDNYNFKFENNIPKESIKLKVGYEVLKSIYKDNSINKTYSESYIKERARCYVFDSSLHTYTLCFLPNEFSNKGNNRLWGFVTQMPNWKWIFTRLFLPVLLAFGLLFYILRDKPLRV